MYITDIYLLIDIYIYTVCAYTIDIGHWAEHCDDPDAVRMGLSS